MMVMRFHTFEKISLTRIKLKSIEMTEESQVEVNILEWTGEKGLFYPQSFSKL